MNYKAINDLIAAMPENPQDRINFLNELSRLMHEASPVGMQPVNNVKWVSLDQVEANDYNPNTVAGIEMQLLYTSILHDGYTQPVVTVYDKARDKYIIVDGFHRYFVCKSNKDIFDRNHGRLPVVVIKIGRASCRERV